MSGVIGFIDPGQNSCEKGSHKRGRSIFHCMFFVVRLNDIHIYYFCMFQYFVAVPAYLTSHRVDLMCHNATIK